MSKWIRNIVAFAVLACLSWYLVVHREELGHLFRLRPGHVAVMFVVIFLQASCTVYVIQSLLKLLKTKTSFWEMFLLQSTVVLLNYVPMKFGTVFRANYLKRHYGFKYAHFATFFLYLTFLMTVVASAISLIVLVAVYKVSSYESKMLAGLLAIVLVVSMLFLFFPLPVPKGSHRIIVTLRNFLSGRRDVMSSRNVFLVNTSVLAISFVLASFRLAIIYRGLQQEINPAGFLVLGSLGCVTLFFSFTPGALGIRELILGLGGVALGVPAQVSILAAMIDRAIIITYTFIVGGGCSIALWRRNPAEFKREGSNSSTSVCK